MAQRIDLVIIDPQGSFCREVKPEDQQVIHDGELYVPGAAEDMQRLGKFIKRTKDKLSKIHVTLDNHQLIDVAHPPFWRNSKGEHPSPFTVISASDVRSGIWTPVLPSLQARMLAYVEALEASGRYPLMIWPPHCLWGTAGATVVPAVADAILEWSMTTFRHPNPVIKGMNPFTEHYSAVRAEVPDPKDLSTNLNQRLVKSWEEADLLIWSGEAYLHCLKNTMLDAFAAFGADSLKKSVVLTDATSPVPVGPYQSDVKAFEKDLKAKGLKFSTTADLLA